MSVINAIQTPHKFENPGENMYMKVDTVLTQLFVLLAIFTANAFGQSSRNLILNGDFENNSAPGEIEDASNILFNFRMDQIKAFGEREGIDIYTTGNVQTDSPQSGDWNIAMRADQAGDSEEISFRLASHIDKDEPYRLEFYMQRLIGSTHDGGKVIIGVSADADTFGHVVYETGEANSIFWQKQCVTFIAPRNAKFLTVKIDNSANNWVGLDNFCLEQAQGELLLNGNFEINNVEEFVEQYDLPHNEFDALMNNVRSIGGGLGGLDILTVTGPITAEESIGTWMVAGGSNFTIKDPDDALSFEMIEPLQVGELYYLEFFMQRGTTPGDIDGSGGSVTVGVSEFDDQLGIEIYQSPLATLGWNRLGTTFVAPSSADYLTVEFRNAIDHWVIVDHFSLRPFTLGDINFDDSVDLLDVAPFVDLILDDVYLAEGDINKDGQLDLLDVTPFVDLILGN